MTHDRTREPADALERDLRIIAADLEFPPTPDLVSQVRLGLSSESFEGQRRRQARTDWLRPTVRARPLRLSLVLALVALAVAATVVAGAAFVLGGLRISFVERLPSAPPESVPIGSLGSNLGLGTTEDLATARSAVQFTVFVPNLPELAVPDLVYRSDVLAGGQISLLYGPGEGRPPPTDTGVAILITEFSGKLEQDLAQKSVGPGTTVEVLTVNDGLGFWIEGRPHVIVYRDPSGRYAQDFMRLVHNSLAWEQGGTVLRIEGDITRERALEIAASFEPAP